jgi:nucleotide-binding universal stress UspA family protein
MFGIIMLATDGSPGANAALACAQRLALAYGSSILVVYVAADAGMTRRIRDQVSQLRDVGIRSRLAVVSGGGDGASVIARLAGAWNADVLMVGATGGGRAMGRVTQRLLELAPCPVLAIPVEQLGSRLRRRA